MRQISSSQAKQSFGLLLEAAAREPVAIARHQKIAAIVASPEYFAKQSKDAALLSERRAARAAQVLIEQERLMRHQRIAIDLLTVPARKRKSMIRDALAVIEQWRSKRLCSADYIGMWETMLGLPTAELARQMVSDLDGWGNALRQNSPFTSPAP